METLEQPAIASLATSEVPRATTRSRAEHEAKARGPMDSMLAGSHTSLREVASKARSSMVRRVLGNSMVERLAQPANAAVLMVVMVVGSLTLVREPLLAKAFSAMVLTR